MAHLTLLVRSTGHAMTVTPHLSAADVAAFLDDTLSREARLDAERHLAVCDACREEAAACARLLDAHAHETEATLAPRSARRIPWRLVVPIAAALLLVVVWRVPTRNGAVEAPRERAVPADDGSRIVIVTPAANAEVHTGAMHFTWRPLEGSTGYNVIVKDASGSPVLGRTVADTSVVVDLRQLRAGETYVWRVDGQRADGTTASSPETGFRVVR